MYITVKLVHQVVRRLGSRSCRQLRCDSLMSAATQSICTNRRALPTKNWTLVPVPLDTRKLERELDSILYGYLHEWEKEKNNMKNRI